MISNFIGILGSEGSGKTSMAEMFGKKGTISDICLYSSSKGPFINIIDPIKYPESFKTLVQTIQLSDGYILCVNSEKGIDKYFGEILLTLRSLRDKNELEMGTIAITNSKSQYDNSLVDKIKNLLKVSNFPQIPIILTDIENKESIQKLKDTLNDQISNIKPNISVNDDAYVEVWVDHAFPVKGVGTVILGKVMHGTVLKGMKLSLLPSNKVVNVKSIQLNDIEEKQAHSGSHVGLAIKGIAYDQLYRGCVLFESDKNGYFISNEIKLKIKLNKYSGPLLIGSSIHFSFGLDFLMGKISNLKTIDSNTMSENTLSANQTGEITILLQRNVFSIPGRTVLISDLNKMPRIQGYGTII